MFCTLWVPKRYSDTLPCKVVSAPGFHSAYPLVLRMINLEPDSVYNFTVESLHSDYGFNDYDGGTFFICTSGKLFIFSEQNKSFELKNKCSFFQKKSNIRKYLLLRNNIVQVMLQHSE